MELSMSGSALKTFNRCITCLARVGSELVLQASPSKLELHTLNASRSAYQSISFTPSFFDIFSVSSSSGASDSSPDPLQCSILLKAVLSVLRTPPTSVDSLAVTLPSFDAAKIQFSLHCLHGDQLYLSSFHFQVYSTSFCELVGCIIFNYYQSLYSGLAYLLDHE